MPPAPVLDYAPPRARSSLLRFFATGPDRPLLQDPAEIDRLYRRSRMGILVAMTLGYGFMYTCRLGLSVVKKPLVDGGLMTTYDLGVLGATIYYGYAFGRLLNGFLADHANLRRFFTTGVLLTACANMVMGFTSPGLLWAILWGLNGWFQGFGAASCIVTIARWFGNHERGRTYGIWSAAHGIGEGLTFVAAAGVVTLWGWRAGFVGPGVFCVFVAMGIYVLMRDRPQTLGLPAIKDWRQQPQPSCQTAEYAGIESAREQQAPSKIDPQDTRRAQLEILKLPALWIICLASATMYVSRYAIIDWGIFYLQEAKGYSLIKAGSILGANTIGGIFGCIAYGFISDCLFRSRRPPVTLIFGVVEVLSLFVIFFAPPGHPVLLTAAFVVYGFTLSGLLAVLGGLFAVDIVPKKAAGAAIGLTGVISYLGAATENWISGLLIHSRETIETVSVLDAAGKMISKQIHHYDFSRPIAFWIGASVVSLLLASSLWRVKMRE